MPSVKIDELDVEFPFEPYEVQKQLMTRVVECCRSRKHGLLESPTGTGKTLSLLCASLAWQKKQRIFIQTIKTNDEVPIRPESMFKGFKSNNNSNKPGLNVPRIIYASRTHSQLSQAIQELKRTYYKNTKAIVLGSRDLMCVHEEVSRLESSSAKIMACHVRMNAHRCTYYNNVSAKKDGVTFGGQTVVDIEDLVTKGKAQKFCPFFMSRELVHDADIVFMPYNYLLDPKLRSTHGIDLKSSVIILDEGHNIAKICEEAVSFEIRSSSIAHCMQEVRKTMTDFADMSKQLSNNAMTKDLSIPNLVSLQNSFIKLEEELDKIQITPEGTLLPGSDLLMILFQNGFAPSMLPRIISDLDAVSSFLTDKHSDTTGCDKFSSILRVLASQSLLKDPSKFGDSYKVFVQYEESKRSKDRLTERSTHTAKVFNFWCFSPALGLETLMVQQPRCVLLASGTLSPMSFLVKELNTHFAVQHTNPHIIKDNQLYASIVTRGPGGIPLSSSYQNRDNVQYLKSLGELIRLTCSVVPKGVLVFFPSYSVMENCKRNWESTGLWTQMSEHKKLFFEPRGKDAFKKAMDDYYLAVQGTSSGGCLMAVCRGKVSEGLDFTDDNGRAVIITGIPYAPAKDPHIVAKQQYLNAKVTSGDRDSINGSTWYQLEATRALNQAIGRIIRHANDFGAILLCDERISDSRFKASLSGWVAQRLKVSSSFDTTLKELAEFFGSSIQKERSQQAKVFMANTKRPTVRIHRPKEQKKIVGLSDESISQQLLMDSAVFDQDDDEGCCSNNNNNFRISPLVGKSKSKLSTTNNNNSNATASSSNKNSSNNQKKCATSSLFGDLVSSSVTSKVDFSSAVPVYPKPFVAFSKTTSPSTSNSNNNALPQENKRKKIKLSSRNCAFAASAEPSTIKGGQETNLESFSDVKEFWTWVKSVLDGTKQPQFVKSMKKYKQNKDVNELYESIRTGFQTQHYKKCVQGLSLIMSPIDIKKLKELMHF